MMAVIKLVEDYAVSQLRKDVRDSLTMAGEQAILLQLYHVGDPDITPCPQCGDDIYKSPEMDCLSCFGTTFNGGVRVAMKVWSMFSDRQVTEQMTKQGIYRPDQREAQFEAFPLVNEHDVIVRVQQWNSDGTPSVLEGFYMLQGVTRRSLRTGSRFGQLNWDVVAQKAQLSELAATMEAITNYPILGKTFKESVQLSPSTPSQPTPAVVAPDVKVIYLPSGGSPGGGVRTFGITVGDGVNNSFPCQHNFGTTDVTVGVFYVSTGEEVTPDVYRTSPNIVTVTFGSTPAPGLYRVVIQGGLSV